MLARFHFDLAANASYRFALAPQRPSRAERMALLLLVVLLRSAASAGAGAEPHRSPATALFVLGDSTVGCAAATASSILPLNLTTTTTTLPSSLSGEPCLFFHEARLRVPDLLAAKMGLPSPPPISALNGTASAAARGVNFGGGGGQLLFYGGGGGVRGPPSVFLTGAVGQQVRLASETLQLLRLEAAAPGEPSSSPAAVFVLSFGADAYARLLARGPAEAAAAAPKHGRRGLARLLADRVARAVSVRSVRTPLFRLRSCIELHCTHARGTSASVRSDAARSRRACRSCTRPARGGWR